MAIGAGLPQATVAHDHARRGVPAVTGRTGHGPVRAGKGKRVSRSWSKRTRDQALASWQRAQPVTPGAREAPGVRVGVAARAREGPSGERIAAPPPGDTHGRAAGVRAEAGSRVRAWSKVTALQAPVWWQDSQPAPAGRLPADADRQWHSPQAGRSEAELLGSRGDATLAEAQRAEPVEGNLPVAGVARHREVRAGQREGGPCVVVQRETRRARSRSTSWQDSQRPASGRGRAGRRAGRRGSPCSARARACGSRRRAVAGPAGHAAWRPRSGKPYGRGRSAAVSRRSHPPVPWHVAQCAPSRPPCGSLVAARAGLERRALRTCRPPSRCGAWQRAHSQPAVTAGEREPRAAVVETAGLDPGPALGGVAGRAVASAGPRAGRGGSSRTSGAGCP